MIISGSARQDAVADSSAAYREDLAAVATAVLVSVWEWAGERVPVVRDAATWWSTVGASFTTLRSTEVHRAAVYESKTETICAGALEILLQRINRG